MRQIEVIARSFSIETIKSAVHDNTAIEGAIVNLRRGPDGV
jgi:hypothetical protein